ncbi:MAG: VOC family protein [Muribaculaceae bacterium]|nr:VOC family protein [Muribaculaceae bacterium]
MNIKSRFDHFNFNVSNLEQSLKFYSEALGLKEKNRINHKNGDFIIVYLTDERSDFLLELTWLRDHTQAYDLGECEFHLCLRVDGDYDEIRSKHKEMGIVCFENTEMGLYFVEDPDGYWIEILQAK